jgi:hypothetical protein
MPLNRQLIAAVVLCLQLLSCTGSGLNPVASPAVKSEVPLPTATIDFSGAKATLTIVRTWKLIQGSVTSTAAIPLLFAIDEDDPHRSVIVWGIGEGTATFIIEGSGTGGTTTLTYEYPVEYEVRGNLTPTKATLSREQCELTLAVDEVLLLSREVIGHSSFLGDIPITGGEDQFTSFSNLFFTEIASTVTRTEGGIEDVFSIDDWCLPWATGCTYGCPAPP